MPASGPIQSSPRGLLGLLQLKNVGQNPELLLDAVQPVLEMRELYISGLLELVAVAATAAAVGPNNVISVPNNETWFIRTVCATTEVLGAAEAIRVQPAIAYGASLLTTPVGDLQAAVTGERVRAHSDPAALLIAGPGDVIGFWVAALTGAVNVDTSVLFARVRS